MGILTRKDVDDLIRVLVEGPQDAGSDEEPIWAKQSRLRVYDFRTPNKFTREDLRSLYTVHQSLANLFALELSARVRIPMNSEVLSVEQGISDRILDSIPSPGFVAVMSMNTLDNAVLLDIEPGFILAMVQRLMGGLPSHEKPRELTEIEQQVARLILEDFIATMQSIWSKTFPVHLELKSIQTDPAFIPAPLRQIPVAVVAFSITYESQISRMRLILPHDTLEPFLSRTRRPLNGRESLNEEHQGTTPGALAHVPREEAPTGDHAGDASRCQDLLLHAIADSYVPLTVEIAEIAATLDECRSLSPGDIVMVGRRIDNPVTVKVKGYPKFRGFLGKSGRHLAVLTTERLEAPPPISGIQEAGDHGVGTSSLEDFFAETEAILAHGGHGK